MRRTTWLLLPLLALAGCGGSDSGTGAASSSSTTGGSSSPTSAPLSTGELKPTSDATDIAATMDLVTTGGVSEAHGVITGGMTSGRMTDLDTPGFSAGYSAQTGYRLSDALNAATFGSGQLTSDRGASVLPVRTSTKVSWVGSVLFRLEAQ